MKVLITAGPTREAIDPVRYLSNFSSGKMGYAIAEAARDAGHEVVLVSGPTALKPPEGVQFQSVISADEMLESVLTNIINVDAFIAVAAVADYRPEKALPEKHKKNDLKWQMNLVKNPDILATVSQSVRPRPFCVGFAAETNNVLRYGREKLERKGLDMIAINDVSRDDLGMDHEYNALHILWSTGEATFPKQKKPALAKQFWQLIEEQFNAVHTS